MARDSMYGGGDYGAHAPDADVRRSVEHQLDRNTDRLNELLLSEGDNGKTSVLGFEIPNSMLPILQMGADLLKIEGIDQSERIFKGTAKLFNGLGLQKNHSSRIAMVIEAAFRWGIITGEQAITLGKAWHDRSQGYKDVLKEYRPVMLATGISSKTNGVIREELKHVDDEFWHQVKLVAATAPNLALMITFGLQKQTEVRGKRQKWMADIEEAQTRPSEQTLTPDQIRNQRLAQFDELAQFEHEIREKYREQGLSERSIDRLLDQIHASEQHGRQDSAPTVAPESKTLKNLNRWASPVSAAMRIEVEKRAPQPKLPATGQLIRHLTEQVNEGEYGRDPYVLKDAILNIFQQYERNNGYSGFGQAMLEHNSQLTRSAELIAEYIADGRLSAMSLVSLVGEDKVIIHDKGQRRFASDAQVQKAIDALLPVMGVRETKKLEDILPDFENPKLAEETIRKNLNGGLSGAERAVFATLFPDDVLKREGLREREVNEMHRQAHPHRQQWIMANAKHLTELGEEKMKALGLGESHMQAVAAMDDAIKNRDLKTAEAAINNDKDLIAALRIAGLNAQMNGEEGAKYWSSRLSEAKQLAIEIKESAQQGNGHPQDDGAGIDTDEESRSGRAERYVRHSGHPGYAGHYGKRQSWTQGERERSESDYRSM